MTTTTTESNWRVGNAGARRMRKYVLTYVTDGNHVDSAKVDAYEPDGTRRSLDRDAWENVCFCLKSEARTLRDMLRKNPEKWVGEFSGFGYYDDDSEIIEESYHEQTSTV